MNLQSIEREISKAINKIIDDFEEYPNKYLTESDVRCFLFNELIKIEGLGQLKETEDGSKSISVHTEVRWYHGKQKQSFEIVKLNYRSDIVIIDVSNLIVKEKLPLSDLFYLLLSPAFSGFCSM